MIILMLLMRKPGYYYELFRVIIKLMNYPVSLLLLPETSLLSVSLSIRERKRERRKPSPALCYISNAG